MLKCYSFKYKKNWLGYSEGSIKKGNNEPSTLHIFDAKYKEVNKQDGDWIKQIIYINNFLNTEINPLKNNLLVDSNIYLIYPGSPNDIEPIKEFRVYNHNLYLIKLDILELLKIFNNGYKEAEEYKTKNTIDKLLVEESKKHCLYPNIRYKPWIPKNCYKDNYLYHAGYEIDNRYSKYKEYIFGDKECTEENTNLTCYYFATKSVEFDGSKYSFEENYIY